MTTPRKRAPRKPAAPKPPTPPPVQDADWGDTEPAYDLAQYHDGHPGKNAPLMLVGCLFVAAFLMMGTVTAWLVYDRVIDAPPAPAVPANDLSAFTAPITAKLSGDPVKAAIVDDAYVGLCVAIAGKTGERLTSSRIFETAHAAFLTDIDATGGVAVGAEIDQAIGSYLGMTKATGDDPGWEPIAFDESHRAKLVEIAAAIALAAEAVR